MGLENLSLDDWIEIDDAFRDQLAEKRRLLAERHAEVFQSLPESTDPSREVLTLLGEHLPRRFPALFRRRGDTLDNAATAERWNLAQTDLHPLDLAGRLVQEDLCVMQAGPEGYRLTAASLCFPTRWRLAEKIGKPMQGIHAPVPLYAERLARPVDRFFDHLRAERPVARVNFSLLTDPALFQPAGHGRREADPTITAENAGARVHLRMERQTLRRLPCSAAILFTIRVHQCPLAVFEDDPRGAADLAASLRTMPEGVALYKSLPVLADPVLAYLDRLSGEGGQSVQLQPGARMAPAARPGQVG
ncbi:MAG: DUF3445 domain-containing protein [Acidisphaera sp.]|nr:DUF3445 domain-containing protein [Sphingomonas sp.]MBV9735153.1 DUF3445 domain-containing protein [Acidisphaera sp.]